MKTSDDNEKHLKYKEVFNELSNEIISEIYNISTKSMQYFNNLTYHFKSSNTASTNSIEFGGSIHIYNEVKNGNISIEKNQEDEKQLKLRLNEITIGKQN